MHRWYRSILFLAIGSCAAVLASSTAALAVCPLQPPPPCGPVGITGRADAPSARCGQEPRRVCENKRGPRGPQGEPGGPGPRGQAGQTGQTGSSGARGATGPRGVEGSNGNTGADGPAGPAGAAGAAGAAGPAGADGAAGPAGQPGAAGETGPQGLQGVRGEVGAAGPEGAPGAAGADGQTGAAGTDGESGAAGETGAAGATGAAGEEGLEGEQGADGIDGTPGADGAAGPAGETGPEGLTGPEGENGLAEYGYVYNTVAETIALGGAVSFGSNGVLSPGIEHVAGSTDTIVTAAGIYEIDFSASTVGPSQLALFVDGIPLTGSTYGSGAGTQQNSGQVLASLPTGAILTLRNHQSSGAVELQPNAGGTEASTNASILITLIDGTP